MPFVKWSDNFSVGVDEIDNDHKKLLEMLNGLFDAVEADEGHAVLSPVLNGLVQYVSYHFDHEEGLFLRTQYPDYAAHKKEHEELTAQVLAAFDKFNSGPTETMPLDVLEFLKKWLYEHILDSDKKFGAYLSASGIKL